MIGYADMMTQTADTLPKSAPISDPVAQYKVDAENFRQRVTAVPSPFGIRFKTNSLLMTRVLLRNPDLADDSGKGTDLSARHAVVEEKTYDASKYIEIPRIPREAVDADMISLVLKTGVPTVLEGVALDSAAVAKWTPEYFKEKCGDMLIPMFKAHKPDAKMPMSEIIDHILAGKSDPIQVNNACDVLTGEMNLIGDLPLDEFGMNVHKARYHGANLFISGAGHGSGYHCANEVNFFFQAYGQKEWFFIHPRYSSQMDPRHTIPRCTYFGSGVEWGQHPARAPIGHVILEPGDVLVNPPWWWHWVRNQTTTIAVATRWMSWRHRFGTDNKYFSSLQWLFPHQWKILWTDYIKGEKLSDQKWVHEKV